MIEKQIRVKAGGPPIFGFGFRPFFFLAGVYSVPDRLCADAVARPAGRQKRLRQAADVGLKCGSGISLANR